MENKKYKAINCGFHDELESAAVKKQLCRIVYLSKEGQKIYSGKILDFYIREKVEYMVLENDLTIRLDQVYSLDDKINPTDDLCGI